MKYLSPVTTIIFLLVTFSCENNKGGGNSPEEDLALLPQKFEYYIDDKEVKKEETQKISTQNVLVICGKKNVPSDKTLQVRYYSTEDQKLKYAASEGIPLDKVRIAENHLSKYADSSGAVKETERTGKVPQWYTEYQADYLSRTLGVSKSEPTKFGIGSNFVSNPKPVFQVGFYAKEYTGGQTRIFSGTGDPWLLLGWQKVISRYHVNWGSFIVYGWIGFYDDTYFRNRYYEAWSWTNMMVKFNAEYGLKWADDRAKSVLHP